jgi:hypothetical protein
MGYKILIIGFQRSGTSLLRRIVDYHPDIKHCIHEKRVLNKPNVNKAITKAVKDKLGLDIDIENDHWGEKVPWYSNGSEIISYTKKWLSRFGEEALVIHIRRHPIDVAISNVKKVGGHRRSTIKMHKDSTSKVNDIFKNDHRYTTIRFEDLVTNPLETVKKVFKFCKLDYSDNLVKEVIAPGRERWKHFDDIHADRAFAHRKNVKN